MRHPQLGMVTGLQALLHLRREQLWVVVPLQQKQGLAPANPLHDVAPGSPAFGHGPLPDHQAVATDRPVQIQRRFMDPHIPAPALQRFEGLLHTHRGPSTYGVHQHVDRGVRLNHRRAGQTR